MTEITPVPESVRKEFEERFPAISWFDDPDYRGHEAASDTVFTWFTQKLEQAEKEVAQECYLQCLAAECGEGECAEAIYTKFPKLVSRLDPQ